MVFREKKHWIRNELIDQNKTGERKKCVNTLRLERNTQRFHGSLELTTISSSMIFKTPTSLNND